MKGERAGVGCCPHSAWFSLHRMSRLKVRDWTFSVKPLMAVSASCNCWSREAMGGEEGGDGGVEISEKFGDVCR